MRIAVISDIHGNLAALEAVLAHIATQGVDRIVNLGDIASGGLFPAETVDRLIPLNLPTIRGNHERQLVEQTIASMSLSDRHAAAALRPDQLEWLASLPPTLALSAGVLLVHGTPDSDTTYFLETVTEHGVRSAAVDEIEQRAAGAEASVILCGHTHIPRVVLTGNGRLIVNPGSVGLPAYDDGEPFPHAVETGSPHARYAILAYEEGRWSAQLLAVNYDWEGAAEHAEANGRNDWAHALRTGRVARPGLERTIFQAAGQFEGCPGRTMKEFAR